MTNLPWPRHLVLLLCLLLFGTAAQSAAASTQTFGSDLRATPTLDSANGADHLNLAGTGPVILPDTHFAEDLALWNTALPNGSAHAPVSGQVTHVEVKGCAVQDGSAPVQTSLGVPVNEFHLQTLTPAANGYHANQTSGAFMFPYCGIDGANEQTVSTFDPIHMCISAGEVVALNSVGGFIPNSSGAPWYPQGLPFRVFAPSNGASVNSFTGAGPGSGGNFTNTGPVPSAGYGEEPGLQLMLRATLGSGDDAYGLCPGGKAAEAVDSNAIHCDIGPGQHAHPSCDGLRRQASIAGPATVRLHAQRDGVNHRRIVKLAAYCANRACHGAATLSLAASSTVVGQASFKLRPQHSGKIRVRLSPATVSALRQAPGRSMAMVLTVKLDNGTSATQAITLRI